MAANAPSPVIAQGLIRLVQGTNFTKATLQNICSVNGLGKGGNKSDLVERITKLVHECEVNQDMQRFQVLDRTVRSFLANPPMPGLQVNLPPISDPRTYASNLPSQTQSFAEPYPIRQYGFQNSPERANGHAMAYSSSQTFIFKPSPFYEILGRYGDVITCAAMSQHRNCKTREVKFSDSPLLQQRLTDSDIRLMAFCAAENKLVQDISFPHQSEIKVNGDEVKANLRGLKNKPGSTKPVDITDRLRFKPLSYVNTIDFTYALTQKAGGKPKKMSIQNYYFGLYICRVTPVATLVGRVQGGKKILKTSVISEITKKAQDTDISATSQKMSLKCPISGGRMKTPCRGISCSHITCFDAESYLLLQEQGPQWICPVCHRSLPFEQLAVDEYAKDILARTSSSADQVTIATDATWSVEEPEQEERPDPKPGHESLVIDIDEDDDGDDSRFAASEASGFAPNPRFMTPSKSIASNGTPMTTASRESSSMPRSGAGTKRREVIDLTGSDDDDDLPLPPAKRQNYGSSNGYSGTNSFY